VLLVDDAQIECKHREDEYVEADPERITFHAGKGKQ
jgi:hypothetical protein